MNFQSILVAPIPIKIIGSFVVQSIWKAWEATKPWLQWQSGGPHKRSSINSLNVWWSPIIQYQELLLVEIQWIHAQRFQRKAISTIADFFSRHNRDWIPWANFNQLHLLKSMDEGTYEVVLDNMPFS